MAGLSHPMPRDFDATAALERARTIQAAKRKLHPLRQRTSRLDRYANEIAALVKLGATARTIQVHLETTHGLYVALSTVTRWMAKHQGETAHESAATRG